MLIGVHERMERRIGLFPAGFDKLGRLYTRTDLGDLPITLPSGPRDQAGEIHPGWFVLSQNKTMTASSSLDDHPPALASDENIRTWWSAKTGGAEEWLQMDLGKAYDVSRGLQINLIEQDYTVPLRAGVTYDAKAASTKPASLDNTIFQSPHDDYHQFKLLASLDGQNWDTVVDESKNMAASPHTYVEFLAATEDCCDISSLQKRLHARRSEICGERSASVRCGRCQSRRCRQ